MKKLLYASLCVCLLASCGDNYRHPMEEDLRRVDAALEQMGSFVELKESRISAIQETLSDSNLTLRQKYGIYGRLYEEYAPYQFDKARQMLQMQECLADSLSDASLRTTATLKKALLLTTAGMYLEAFNTFDVLDTATFDYGQKILWWNLRRKFLFDYQEYLRPSGMTVPESDKIGSYINLILENTPENSSTNRHLTIMRMIWDGRWEEAYEENLHVIESLNRNSRDYAVQTYWQGFICENLEREDEVLKWWAESAICDIQGAIKDNAALCSIAVKLTHPEDTERAFRYIRLSLEDAVFYNAKLRKVQIASTMPWIEKAYMEAKEKQSRDHANAILMTSVAAVLLLFAALSAVYMRHKMKRNARRVEEKNLELARSNESIAAADESLRKTNLELVEANAAKEEYLGLFLSMSSGYLDKLRKTISREQYESELKNFYKTFDRSFLSLYPTFVEEFNALLSEDSRVVLKDGELLNTELRIFALIKLGITQSSHIASLLRYSVNTIYNYRAQVKNAALTSRENFEENVQKIGSARS